MQTRRTGGVVLHTEMNSLSEQVEKPTFDTERAYRNTEALCYPRGVGTAGEKAAADYISGQFAALGLETVREPFMASHFLRKIGNPIFFALCLQLVIVGAALIHSEPILATGCWALAGLGLHSPWRRRNRLGRGWPPRTQSENI